MSCFEASSFGILPVVGYVTQDQLLPADFFLVALAFLAAT